MRKIVFIVLAISMVVNLFAIEKFKISAPDIFEGIEKFNYPKEVLNKALLNLGYEAEYLYLPTERALREADHARCDGTFLRVKEITAQYKNLMAVDEPLITIKSFAYTIKNDISDISWDKLRKYNTAVIIGSKIHEKELKDKMTKGTFIPVVDYETAYKQLEEGTVDYVTMFDILEIKYTKDIKDIKRCTPHLSENTFYFLINKKHSNIAEKLAKEIKKIKEDELRKNAKSK